VRGFAPLHTLGLYTYTAALAVLVLLVYTLSLAERVSHPGFDGPISAERVFLSDDPDTAVAETIERMARYVRADADSPSIQALASQMRGGSRADTIARVWNWIRARVRFVPDSANTGDAPNASNIAEVLIRPVDIIRMRDAAGDCDDFSMLGAALFRALGIPVLFCTVAADPTQPDQFSHVYLYVDGSPFDASHGAYLGWECPNRFGKILFWSVDNGMPIMRNGLGYAPAGSDWWQTLIQQGTDVGLSIAKARYGVPPPGTVIQIPDGMISTGVSPSGAALLNVGTSPGTAGLPMWVWLAAAALVVFMMMGRRK